ncbi:MAG: beta-lactamase family protein [Lachnospiraceae bacterium]|nr:beta-lactamase family protein [Lachnospiraceae bacterium]
MRFRNHSALLLTIISMISALPQGAYASNTDEIDNLIRQYKHDTKCENVSVVVYDNTETSCYGDSEDLYQIGSMTKAFTGLAVQMLIGEGLVDEDGVISDYIPGYEAYYDSEKVDITVRNLLEQKSGYTNSEKDYPSATDTMTLSDWAADISGRELCSRPGTEYAYSNVNYNLLGLIIENVSGMPYREYMEKELLIPLGLDDTHVGMPSDGRIAQGSRIGFRHAFDYPMTVREASVPAGYFYSSVVDMGRWIEIWTGNTDVPEGLKEPLAKVKGYLNKDGDYYCGWELFEDGVIGHSGGTPNYSSRIVFDEKRKIGVCVLANLNVAATTDSLCNSIYDVVSGKDPSGLNVDIWTIFDKIFTGVTIAGILLFVMSLMVRNRTVLTVLDVVLAVLLMSVLILFPIIFGAGLKEILLTWAPWSVTGGLVAIGGVVTAATIRISTVKKYADHNKAGKR